MSIDRSRPLRREPLGPPRDVDPRPRQFFDPSRGLLRRFERRVGVLLSRHVFPRIPALRFIYDLQLERGLTLVQGEIALPGLKPGLDGATLLLICDLHAGPFVSPAALERSLQRLQGVAPDLVLLGGDLVTSRSAEMEDVVGALERLRPPLGLFAVLGNHDHYTTDPRRIVRDLERLGVQVLQNRSTFVRRRDAVLCLCGVDDLLMGEPDLDAALGQRTEGVPTVLLSHNPDVFLDAAPRADLVLAGHTHGGQIRFFGSLGMGVLVRMSRFRLDEGRHRWRGSELVVSRGLGVTGLPLRFACAPEATLLTLRAIPRSR